jgi:hypothetical protein
MALGRRKGKYPDVLGRGVADPPQGMRYDSRTCVPVRGENCHTLRLSAERPRRGTHDEITAQGRRGAPKTIGTKIAFFYEGKRGDVRRVRIEPSRRSRYSTQTTVEATL